MGREATGHTEKGQDARVPFKMLRTSCINQHTVVIVAMAIEQENEQEQG